MATRASVSPRSSISATWCGEPWCMCSFTRGYGARKSRTAGGSVEQLAREGETAIRLLESVGG
jgi:hypothetical protein